MMLPDRSERRGVVLVVGVGTYDDAALNRPAVERAAHEFVRLFNGTAHVDVAPALIGNAAVDDIFDGVKRWGEQGSVERSSGLLLWTGHAGVDNDGRPFLYASNRQFSPEDLGRELANSGIQQCVVILDCCYGYTAGGPISRDSTWWRAVPRAASRS